MEAQESPQHPQLPALLPEQHKDETRRKAPANSGHRQTTRAVVLKAGVALTMAAVELREASETSVDEPKKDPQKAISLEHE